ncbi:MAG: YihY/virulence factor BrkB family protein [Beijerinckiaceae bacterium]|nr:YihY/virulence factor BrkB family protein [Beijerinckiaceae bacterium]
MQNKPGFIQAAALAFASRFVASPTDQDAATPANARRALRDKRTRGGRDGAREPVRASQASSRASQPEPGKARDDGARGEGAQEPTQIPARGWKEIAKRVWEQIGKDRVAAVAAGVTFYGLLAIFPLLAALVSIYGFVADPATINEHLRTMSSVLPGGALDVVGEQVNRIASQPRGQLGFGFIAGLAVTLWSANAGMKAIFDALNVAYGEDEKRSFFRLNLQSMTFTILAIASAIVAMLAVVVLPPALAYIGLGGASQWLITIGRWPLLLVGLVLALAVLYRYGPSRDEPRWSWISPGALVAAFVWLAASLAFSFYAQNFGSYNETYGSLGAVIGFMTWMWISVTIVLVGAEINAEAEHQTEADTTRGPETPIGQRGARVADEPAPSPS